MLNKRERECVCVCVCANLFGLFIAHAVYQWQLAVLFRKTATAVPNLGGRPSPTSYFLVHLPRVNYLDVVSIWTPARHIIFFSVHIKQCLKIQEIWDITPCRLVNHNEWTQSNTPKDLNYQQLCSDKSIFRKIIFFPKPKPSKL
jgi:hypothetical protein